jgi:hypothetical protein
VEIGNLSILAPATAPVNTGDEEQDAVIKKAVDEGLANLTVHGSALIQGNVPMHALTKDGVPILDNRPNHFDHSQQEGGDQVAGVNLFGHEALIHRMHKEGKLMVINSFLSMLTPMTPTIFNALSDKQQEAAIAACTYQLLSRVPPHLPFAAGLISDQIKTGANYNTVYQAFSAICSAEDLNLIGIEDCTEHQKRLAEKYCKAVFEKTRSTPEGETDVLLKMHRMVYALEKMSPEIWLNEDKSECESVFIGLDRNTMTTQEPFKAFYGRLLTLARAGNVAFFPPMYDLIAVGVFEHCLHISPTGQIKDVNPNVLRDTTELKGIIEANIQKTFSKIQDSKDRFQKDRKKLDGSSGGNMSPELTSKHSEKRERSSHESLLSSANGQRGPNPEGAEDLGENTVERKKPSKRNR